MPEDKLLTNHVLWDYLRLIKNVGEQLAPGPCFIPISDIKHVTLNFIQAPHISLSSWLDFFCFKNIFFISYCPFCRRWEKYAEKRKFKWINFKVWISELVACFPVFSQHEKIIYFWQFGSTIHFIFLLLYTVWNHLYQCITYVLGYVR